MTSLRIANILKKISHHDINDTTSNKPITNCTSTLAWLMRCTNDKSCVTSISTLSPSILPLPAQYLRHADRLETFQQDTHQMHFGFGQHFSAAPHRLQQGNAAATEAEVH